MKLNDKEIIEFKRRSTSAIIDWILGNYCNYKCSYCFPNCNTGTVRLPKINSFVKNNILHIVDQLKLTGIDDVVFSLAGGEPTLYHDFDNLANFLHCLGQIKIITNASRTMRWWKEHIHLLDFVQVSYHSEFVDIDKLIEVVDFLEEEVHVALHVMVNPKLFDKCINDYKLLQERYKDSTCNVVLNLIRDTTHRVTLYTDEQLKILDSIYYQTTGITEAILEDGSIVRVDHMSVKNLHGSWNGYRCFAHHEFLQIGLNGNVGRLSCGQQYTKHANIFNANFIEKFLLPKNEIICERDVCGCMGLFISKKQRVERSNS